MGGEGGRVGPALDRIASRRAPEFLMESILQPSKDIAPEFEAVAVATKDGRVITGLRINETNFSIQLREENGRFHSFLKRDLEEVKVLQEIAHARELRRAADRQGTARPVRVPDDAGVSPPPEPSPLRAFSTRLPRNCGLGCLLGEDPLIDSLADRPNRSAID